MLKAMDYSEESIKDGISSQISICCSSRKIFVIQQSLTIQDLKHLLKKEQYKFKKNILTF